MAKKSKSAKQQVVDEAKKILEDHPQGMRFGELEKKIEVVLSPPIPGNTVWGYTSRLLKHAPAVFYQPSYGQYALIQHRDAKVESAPKGKEEDIYEPLAAYLTDVENECTKAITVGGARSKDKWMTPDVIGVFKHLSGDHIQFPPEIVSAEVKRDTGEAMEAFGQACAYKQFSHKSYIVVPKSWAQSDLNRLKSVCPILGIGLIFYALDKEGGKPDFETVIRAQKHDPDMRVLNDFLRKISGVAQTLFG